MEREDAVWKTVDRAFAKPVVPTDQTTEYAPTQVLAEVFRADGADGILYKSLLTDNGHNLVLFGLNHAELHSCELHVVDNVSFSFAAVDSYTLRKDGMPG